MAITIPDELQLAIRISTQRARDGDTKALDEMASLIKRFPILVHFDKDQNHPMRALADLHITGSKRLLIEEMAKRGEPFRFNEEVK